MKICPAKLEISMKNDFPKGEIRYKIQVTNPSSHPINVTSSVRNPTSQSLSPGYTNIPDLSWVNVEPKVKTIPANSYDFFNLTINIPENEKKYHYNESWEVWAIFYSPDSFKSGGSVSFNIKLAVKIFIHTPSGVSKLQLPQSFYLLMLGTFFTIICILVYIKKRVSLTRK